MRAYSLSTTSFHSRGQNPYLLGKIFFFCCHAARKVTFYHALPLRLFKREDRGQVQGAIAVGDTWLK